MGSHKSERQKVERIVFPSVAAMIIDIVSVLLPHLPLHRSVSLACASALHTTIAATLCSWFCPGAGLGLLALSHRYGFGPRLDCTCYLLGSDTTAVHSESQRPTRHRLSYRPTPYTRSHQYTLHSSCPHVRISLELCEFGGRLLPTFCRAFLPIV